MAEQDQSAIAAILGGGREGELQGREDAVHLLDTATQRGHAICMAHDAA